LGTGLSAACGFRLFIPPLTISIAALYFGVQLPQNIAWFGTFPAFFTFLTATLLEVGAYYVPWVDNVLDHIAGPAAVIAGTLITFAFLGNTDIDPWLKWALALVAGGGSAATVSALTSTTRLSSLLATAGFANPLIATAENIAAVFFSALSFSFPLLAIGLIVLVISIIGFLLYKASRLLSSKRLPENPPQS
jgi:hypothetical protein